MNKLFLALGLVVFSINPGCKKDEPAKLPTLTTTGVTAITASTASGGGTISSDGGAAITVRGVCWGLTEGPTTSDTKTSDGTGKGQFTSSLTGLAAGTSYHIRAYATNSAGTAYGEDMTFVTLGQAPLATTLAATNITSSGATLNGTITANDLATTVTFEYGTTTSYGLTANATPSEVTGNAATNASANISGLSPGVTYHFRIKAINSLGTVYGSDLTFMTSASVPIATTMAASNTTSSGATLNGNVNANGAATTISFEYGLTASYGQTVSGVPSQIPATYNVAVYAAVSGLSSSTTYHFRVKAVNSAGTSYGSDLTFTTSGGTTTVSDIDGNVYNTVTIGTQTWFKENLKVTKYTDGTAIPNITDNTAWSSASSGAYCDYSNTPSTSAIYGRLYNWYVVTTTNSKKVCPSGWHAPSDAEWTTLVTYLGGELVAGGKMKETGTSHWLTPNASATNSSGFTGLPAGYRSETGTFGLSGNSGYWWSSTEGGTTFGWDRYLYYNNAYVVRGDMNKNGGFSVRCIKN
jgi:uncharacterized protein (TIGR02145 family)